MSNTNERLAEAVKLLRRVMDAHTGESRWRQDEWDVLDDDVDAFLRALDAAPTADDVAALVAVGAAYVKLRHLAERLSPASIDEDRAAAIALDDAYAAYRKAPVQG